MVGKRAGEGKTLISSAQSGETLSDGSCGRRHSPGEIGKLGNGSGAVAAVSERPGRGRVTSMIGQKTALIPSLSELVSILIVG